MRRCFSLLTAAAGIATIGTACVASPAGEPREIRRIVTIEDAHGAATVFADGPAPNAHWLNGSRIARLWETSEMPVPLSIRNDAGKTAGNAYRDGFVGSSLYIADIPPGSDLDDIPLHRQDSLDYIAVLDGEILLVLPDRQLRLRRGDVLVQAGNRHSWINDSDTVCRLLVVVLTGTRAP